MLKTQITLIVLTFALTGILSNLATAADISPTDTIASSDTTVYGLPVERFVCTDKLDKPYSICSHLSRPPKDLPDGRGWEMRDKQMQRMNDANITNFRTDFDWDRIQPSPDAKLYLDHLDTLLQSADQYNLTILPILGGAIPEATPAWKHLDIWTRHVAELTERYKEKIPVWEVWNEMNYHGFWRDKVSPANYVTLLRETSKIIRENDPKAKVMFGGLASLDMNFLDGVCKNKGYEYFDIMNYHVYFHNHTPETLISEFRRLKRLMRKYNWDKPVWITETGANTAQADYEDEQSLGFFTEVLPQTLSKLEITPTQVGILSDQARGFIGAGLLDADQCLGYFSSRRYVTLDQLETLNPQQTPVLILQLTEAFPTVYFDALESYIATGGTVVFSSGVPLYKDIIVSGEKLGDISNNPKRGELEKRLHINSVLWWSSYGKELGAPEKPDWQKPAPGFEFTYNWDFSTWRGSRYIDAKNLQPGDEFIPILQSGNDKFTGVTIGAYKLNSNLKGNVIIQTRNAFNYSVKEKTQAERVARAYLIAMSFGVDKVFWYNLRSLERNETDTESHFGLVHADMSAKPGFIAYQTLSKFCPDQSSRPSIQEQNSVFLATWQKPDSVTVAAVWTAVLPVEVNLQIIGSPEYYDYLGKKLNLTSTNFIAKPDVIYIVGADTIKFNEIVK